MNYQEAKDLFESARNKEKGKKIANNTYIVMLDDYTYAVRLHETNIVTFYSNGDIKLDSGTWRTVTTKERMNRYLSDLRVLQESGMWYVGKDWNDKQSLFFDGIEVNGGKILNPKLPTDTEFYKKKVDKMVSKYIKGFVQHVLENGVQNPDNVDCWACLMKDKNDPTKPDPLGIDHYLSHFEENYYVPSLLFNAFMETPFGNHGFVWSQLQHNTPNNQDYIKYEVAHILRRFFQKRKLTLVQELSKRSI